MKSSPVSLNEKTRRNRSDPTRRGLRRRCTGTATTRSRLGLEPRNHYERSGRVGSGMRTVNSKLRSPSTDPGPDITATVPDRCSQSTGSCRCSPSIQSVDIVRVCTETSVSLQWCRADLFGSAPETDVTGENDTMQKRPLRSLSNHGSQPTHTRGPLGTIYCVICAVSSYWKFRPGIEAPNRSLDRRFPSTGRHICSNTLL